VKLFARAPPFVIELAQSVIDPLLSGHQCRLAQSLL
jgi:hypothetical protein